MEKKYRHLRKGEIIRATDEYTATTNYLPGKLKTVLQAPYDTKGWIPAARSVGEPYDGPEGGLAVRREVKPKAVRS